MSRTEVAVLSFGLGARPGELLAAAGDPRGWLAGGTPGRFYFLDDMHQPGATIFLGKTYYEEGQRQGEAELADLRRKPATARFIATKLVRHFIADDPPAAAVDRVARAFLTFGGDLPQMYAALIESSEAWEADVRKFKTPENFVFSTLRALGVTPQKLEEVVRSFVLLGQRQFTAESPAGWPTPPRIGSAPTLGCIGCCGHRASPGASSKASILPNSRHPASAPICVPRR